MKILITGGSGLLGSNLIKILEKDHQVFSPSSRDLNIINSILVTEYIDSIKPDVIIHCAAIAKFAIAESKPIDTININVIGTCNIVKTCIAHNIRMVYISTSHVFDGKKGNYSADDNINPLTKYSKSKAAGEMVTSFHPNSLIIRTEFCEETFPFETAYIDKFSSKEYIDIIAPKIAEKCLSDQIGVCHVGGPRRSFYEFGKLRNPNVKEGTVKDLISTSTIPILIDTSLISN
jgi:dTDP-4-dehydrorhamnose reductase